MEFELVETENVPVKAWVKGVELEAAAREQIVNLAHLPFMYSHVAVMPDVHWGRGATVGSVIATKGAIIPAAVGEFVALASWPGSRYRLDGQHGIAREMPC